MLPGKRATRVGKQILRFLAELLMTRIRDPRLKGVTFTGINLSNDLKNARIFFSVLGSREETTQALTGLDSAKGFIKRELGSGLKLRNVPDIIFDHDLTLETGNRLEKLFKQIHDDEKG
ncbi:MAG: 30S ribosome-binding factor RbfA [Deltaproteobacteria bacterium]|jgi:ribosome-binding factor A|nr:30S ribosome-binding factor RbfA [Deltaproteobacteria bacterium]